MATVSVLSNFDALRLLNAIELFEKTYGSFRSELELQATVGALATIMHITNYDLDVSISRVTAQYKRTKYAQEAIKAIKHKVSKANLQSAKARLTDAENTLLELLRTYLQRVSSKLSAAAFVELTKVAIALLHTEQKLSLAESRRLLYIALQTFGGQLSQPIPPLGEKIPKPIARLVLRLVRYQKIVRTHGLKAVLITLASQTLQDRTQRLTPDVIRDVLKHHHIILAPKFNTQESLEDLANVLLFTLQLQTAPHKVTKSDQEIAEQIDQAVTEFKAKYRSVDNVMQPQWDSELSVSSPLFTPSNFEVASGDFEWLSQPDETLKDETNS